MVKYTIKLLFLLLLSSSAVQPVFIHQNDVVAKMKKIFKNLNSYSAKFKLASVDGRKKNSSGGTAYFKKGGKIKFKFSYPSGDEIISNGKKLWVYIAKLRAVGIQDLNYKKGGKSIYSTSTYEGLVALFDRYHVKFDSLTQPRKIKDKEYFVLALKEKVVSGGFKHIKLFVDAKHYLINKIEAKTTTGKIVKLELTNIKKNPTLKENLFTFTQKSVKRVENALTTEMEQDDNEN